MEEIIVSIIEFEADSDSFEDEEDELSALPTVSVIDIE